MHDRIARDASPWSDWGNSWTDWDGWSSSWTDWESSWDGWTNWDNWDGTWDQWDSHSWSTHTVHRHTSPILPIVVVIVVAILIAVIIIVVARRRRVCCFQQPRRPIYTGVHLTATSQQQPAIGGSGGYQMGVCPPPMNTTHGISSQPQQFHPPPGSYPVQPGVATYPPVNPAAHQYSSTQPGYHAPNVVGAEPDPRGCMATTSYNQPQAEVDVPPPSYDSVAFGSTGIKPPSSDNEKQEIGRSAHDVIMPSAPPPP